MEKQARATSAVSREGFLKTAAAGAAALSLANLGAAGRRPLPEVTVWNFVRSSGFLTWLQGKVAAFQQLHPYIRVTLASKDGDTQEQALHDAEVAGFALDLCIIDAALLPTFARSGSLLNIDRFPDFATFQQIYVPAYLAQMNYRGRVYGLPLNAQPYVLAGNRALLGRAPLPRTWTAFVELARAHTSTSGGVYGYTFPGGGSSDTSDRFAAWVFSAGGRILSPDGLEPAFNGPGGVAALQMLVDMEKKGALSSSASTDTMRDSLGSFIRGEVALDTEGPWVQDIMNTYGGGSTNLEVGPLPAASPPVEPNPPATLVNMMMIGMWSATRSPSAAWELLKFLRDEKADLDFTSGVMGGLPVVNAAYVPALRWSLVGKEAFGEAAQSVQPWPAVAQIGLVQTQIAAAVSSALGGARSPKRALDAAAFAVAPALLNLKPKPKRKAAG